MQLGPTPGCGTTDTIFNRFKIVEGETLSQKEKFGLHIYRFAETF